MFYSCNDREEMSIIMSQQREGNYTIDPDGTRWRESNVQRYPMTPLASMEKRKIKKMSTGRETGDEGIEDTKRGDGTGARDTSD